MGQHAESDTTEETTMNPEQMYQAHRPQTKSDGNLKKENNILSINELTRLENYKLWHQEQDNCLPHNLMKQMRLDHQQHTI